MTDDNVTLRNYVDQRFNDLIRMLSERQDGLRLEMELRNAKEQNELSAIRAATDKASAAMEYRLEGMNEWRSESRERQLDFPTRQEMSAQVQSTMVDRDQIRATIAGLATRLELEALGDKLDLLQSETDRSEGRRTVTSAMIAIGSSALISLIIGVVLFFLYHH